jgi:glycosyltransferase involved in cell wall biosynthesis
MKVLYFGTYEKDYPRNRVVIDGLRKNNVQVIECHVPFSEIFEDKKRKFRNKFFLALKLNEAHWKLLFKSLKYRDCDVVIVGYIGQLDMLLTKVIFPEKKIIFNPMLSLYDTIVLDRKWIKDKTGMSNLLKFFDKYSCKLADVVCLDTEEHAKYFNEEFAIEKEKLKRLFIGAEERIFYPRKEKETTKEKRRILFYGQFTPLHGTSYIIRAAKLLEKNKNIEFEIIGKGQTYEQDMALVKELKVKNIKFIDWVPYDKLPEHIGNATLCLGGHFGSGRKAKRVVPNKVFQMIAMKKPVIVSNSKASREAGFIDKENTLFCKMEDEKAIASSILLLMKDDKLRKKISENSYKLFTERYSTKAIGMQMIDIIKNIK